ncbi:MAG: substrate-binding domain-containing protein [Candidatus Thiodiazotropha sp.]
MKKFVWILLFTLLAGCDMEPDKEPQAPQLLIYCGITMAHPIKEIAAIVEKQKNVKILITQGGSEDLYRSLALSHKGDLYLPGSASYRKRHIEEGLLGGYVEVGYNQLAMMVRKGNPRKLKNDLKELLRKDIAVVIGNADSGSVGRESKRVLEAAGIYDQVLDNTVYLTTDSRNLNRALREHEADVILNWRATAFFDENREAMEVIDLDPKLAAPKQLLLNQLVFSGYPEESRYFMEFAASDEGQAIFRKYGFLDNQTRF